MRLRSLPSKITTTLLVSALGSAGCAAESTGDPVGGTHRVALDLQRIQNTYEDYAFEGKPLELAQYFEFGNVAPSVAELETSPEKLFQMDWVDFGDRAWERVGANRFDLVGSDGNVSVRFTSNFRNLELRAGNNTVPFKVAGTPAERQVKVGVLAGLAMSGADPTELLLTAPIVVGAFGVVAIIVVGKFVLAYQDSSQTFCQQFVTNCAISAEALCAGTGVASSNPTCGGSGSFGESGSSSTMASCNTVCHPTGGGGGGSAGTLSAGDSFDSGATLTAGDSSAGDDAGDGDDGGGDDGGEESGDVSDTDDCTESFGMTFHVATMSSDPSGGGGTMTIGAAEDTSEGGGC